VDARERYDEIADDLAARDPDVQLGQMMGMPSIKCGGKIIAGFWNGSMAFKLPDEAEREQALEIEGAHLFDPGGRDRPMKEWVEVPGDHEAEWPALAEKALKLRKGNS
jgi:hypothetical protein